MEKKSERKKIPTFQKKKIHQKKKLKVGITLVTLVSEIERACSFMCAVKMMA